MILLPGKHCCIVRIKLYNLDGDSSVLNKACTLIFNDIMCDVMAKYFYNVSPTLVGWEQDYFSVWSICAGELEGLVTAGLQKK